RADIRRSTSAAILSWSSTGGSGMLSARSFGCDMFRIESLVPVATASMYRLAGADLKLITNHSGVSSEVGTTRRLLSLSNSFGLQLFTLTTAPTYSRVFE